MYAPVATGRPKAVVPSGKERSWFTLIPISNKARASHCSKSNNQYFANTILKEALKLNHVQKQVNTEELQLKFLQIMFRKAKYGNKSN